MMIVATKKAIVKKGQEEEDDKPGLGKVHPYVSILADDNGGDGCSKGHGDGSSGGRGNGDGSGRCDCCTEGNGSGKFCGGVGDNNGCRDGGGKSNGYSSKD
jgi:hypothetical protein